MKKLIILLLLVGVMFGGTSSFAEENPQNGDIYQVESVITDKINALELILARINIPNEEYDAYNCTSGDGGCGVDCGPGECCTSGWDYCYCVPC